MEGNFSATRQLNINTRIHVATAYGSDGEHKGGVSKAIAESGDSKAVINAAKT